MASFALAAAFFATCIFAQDNPCRSYGVDFQNNGTYFQNSLSSDSFTAVQEFSGCENDVSYNILVQPSGDYSECSQTPLTPDNTPQEITCNQWPKNKLYSGEWSLVIFGNNGQNGLPFNYQREFSLTVGPQQTSTVTPTVTLTQTSTPIVTQTQTISKTITSTLNPITKTQWCFFFCAIPTFTFPPQLKVVESTTTQVAGTQTIPTGANVKNFMVSATATCVTSPDAARIPDPTAHLQVSLPGRPFVPIGGKQYAVRAPEATPVQDLSFNSAKFRRSLERREKIEEHLKMAYVEERHIRILEAGAAVVKRAPDAPTVTVTDSDTAHYSTTTNIITASPTTVEITSTALITTTSTPPPTTIVKPILGEIISVFLPWETHTVMKSEVAPSIQKTNVDVTIPITTTATPSASVKSCALAGGYMR